MATTPVDCQCKAFQAAVDVLGRPWNAFLLTMLQEGALRFSEISARPNGPGDKVLSARLKLLEEHGLVSRRGYSTHPPRDEYLLTDKGRELVPVVTALRQWGARHYVDDAELVHAACDHRVELLAHCPHCERDVEPTELTVA